MSDSVSDFFSPEKTSLLGSDPPRRFFSYSKKRLLEETPQFLASFSFPFLDLCFSLSAFLGTGENRTRKRGTCDFASARGALLGSAELAMVHGGEEVKGAGPILAKAVDGLGNIYIYIWI